MKNGKYCNGKKSLNMKPLAVLLALTLLVGCAIGGTIAWLTAQTGEVVNTFTVGDINIDLKEYALKEDGTLDTNQEVTSNTGYKFVPGDTLLKDPFVKVKEGSEKCYLFIKVKVVNNSATDDDNAAGTTAASVQDILSWTVLGQDTTPVNTDPTTNWVAYTAGDDVTNGVKCYYRVVEKQTVNDNGQDDYTYFHILKDNKVTVSQNVVKEVVDEINAAKPMLTFDAAAIQFDNITDVNDAWTKLPTEFTTP